MTHRMHRRYPRRWLLPILLAGLAGASPSASQVVPTTSAIATEGEFLRENDAAMTTMMAGMAVKPSGDVDRDFAAMMIPHHQGAIDMAIAELRHGHNEQLKRIAQEIIVDQQQEIAAMRLALGEPLPPAMSAPTRPRHERGTGIAPQHQHAITNQDASK